MLYCCVDYNSKMAIDILSLIFVLLFYQVGLNLEVSLIVGIQSYAPKTSLFLLGSS